jgi:hypothetical protein
MDLYVNEAGATKSIPMSEWENYIRMIKQYVLCDPTSFVKETSGGGEGMGGGRRQTDPGLDLDESLNERRGRSKKSGNRRSSCPEVAQEGDYQQAGKEYQEGKQSNRHRSRSRRATSNRRSSCPEAAQDDAGNQQSNYPNISQDFISNKVRASMTTSHEYDSVKNLWKEQNSSKEDPHKDSSVVPKRRSSAEVDSSGHGRNVRMSEDYLDRHYKPIRAVESEDEPPIRQWSENTGETGRSTIFTNHGSIDHKAFIRSKSAAAIDEVNDRPAVAVNDSYEEDDESRHVKWNMAPKSPPRTQTPHMLGQKNASETDLHQSMPIITSETGFKRPTLRKAPTQSTPIITSDTGFKRPSLRRSQTEHEGDRRSTFAKQKHMRRSTANDITKETKESKKERHSRRASYDTGLTESQRFNESQLLNAFAAIKTPSRMEDID